MAYVKIAKSVEAIDPPRGEVSRHPGGAGIMLEHEVYFVLAKHTGLVKIGYATDAASRVASLQVGCPEPLGLIGVIHTYLPQELERDLHCHFAADRVRGEWFRCTEELVAYIEQFARGDWEEAA